MKRRQFRMTSLALAIVLLLSSCGGKSKPAELDRTSGVSRQTVQDSIGPSDNEIGEIGPKNEENAGNTSEESGKTTWKKENGVYVYNFPERDERAMADRDALISAMSSADRSRFSDQPDDWFFAKTVRDESSGEVTVVWERNQDTLDTVSKYGAIYRGDESKKVCYFTFDCGYEYGTTSKILDVLKEKGVPATFFINGHYVDSAADMVERMLSEGHIIGNHAVNHYDLTGVSAEVFLDEVEGLEKAYREKFPDAPPMRYFRPPSGDCNEWVLDFANRMGYTTVLWSWAYLDYDTANQPTGESAMAKLKEGLHNGCVYLFHPESETNATMMGDFIDYIFGEGYEILPLCAIDSEE